MAQTRAQKAAAKAKALKQAALAAPSNEAAADSAPVVAAPAIDKSKKVAGAAQSTVFVASKVPRGLYLQLFEFVTMDVKVLGGGVDKRVQPMRLPEKVRIRPAILAPGLTPAYLMVDGFSITDGVPADFWRKWMEQNEKLEIVESGLIRGFDTQAEAIAYAKEHAGMRTGLEPLSQEGDPRVQTSMNENLGDIEIDSDTPRPKGHGQASKF